MQVAAQTLTIAPAPGHLNSLFLAQFYLKSFMPPKFDFLSSLCQASSQLEDDVSQLAQFSMGLVRKLDHLFKVTF